MANITKKYTPTWDNIFLLFVKFSALFGYIIIKFGAFFGYTIVKFGAFFFDFSATMIYNTIKSR